MSVRQPRAWLKAGGRTINLLSCTVIVTRYGFADKFYAKMALDDPSNPGPEFWSSGSDIEAAIVATNDARSGETKPLCEGNIEMVEINWNDRVVDIEGSDKSAAMMEGRSDQNFPNMTHAQIVEKIAGSHGLNLHIDPSSMMAGKTYNMKDYSFNSDVENEWDVIQQLAQMDGKIAYVVGNDFYYTDPGNIDGNVYEVRYTPPSKDGYASGNFIQLKTTLDIPLNQVSSEAPSWHSFQKEPQDGGGENGDVFGGADSGTT